MEKQSSEDVEESSKAEPTSPAPRGGVAKISSNAAESESTSRKGVDDSVEAVRVDEGNLEGAAALAAGVGAPPDNGPISISISTLALSSSSSSSSSSAEHGEGASVDPGVCESSCL